VNLMQEFADLKKIVAILAVLTVVRIAPAQAVQKVVPLNITA